MTRIRLQKFLSNAGVCSRRKGETLIVAGRVAVNGDPVTALGTRVDPEKDRVTVDGRLVEMGEPRLYIALNKPKGVVSSCRQSDRRVVTDLVPASARLFPMGRLDKDSTGLLILTNDGELHHRLLHPSFDHEKAYEVTTKTPVEEDDLSQMAAGILLAEGRTRPARLRRISKHCFRIGLKEGKKRQIRRMVEALGNRVVELKRIRFAGIDLGKLPEGKWRYLTPREIRRLTAAAGRSDAQGPPGIRRGTPGGNDGRRGRKKRLRDNPLKGPEASK